MVVLVALAAMLVPLAANIAEDAHQRATEASLKQLQEVILNRYAVEMRGVLGSPPFDDAYEEAVFSGLPGENPANVSGTARHLQLKFLFVAPTGAPLFESAIGRGWRRQLLSGRGTYPGHDADTALSRGFDEQYGTAGDETVLDGWGNPIVIAVHPTTSQLALVSAGPDRMLEVTNAAADDWQNWVPLQ